MIYTLQNICKRVAFGTGQNVDTLSLNASILAMAIDDAQDKLVDTILEIRPSILSAYVDLTLTGAEEYTISDIIKWDYEAIVKIQDITNADTPVRTAAFNWGDSEQYSENAIYPVYTAWTVRGGSLVFPGKDNDKTMRIWYTRRPVGLFYGTATAGASTSVTFPATATVGEVILVDDYYIGMKVHATGQIRTITDYVGATRVATVDSAWTTTPGASTAISLISPLPTRHHKLIADLAIRRIKVDVDDDDSLIRQFINEETALMNSRLSKSQVQTPEFVRKVRL